MGKILVIGAAGLIGKEVVKALGESECIRASRSSDEPVDISDPKSLAALFARLGTVDGIVCTGGAARYKPWDQLTDEDWTFSPRQQIVGSGQCRPLRTEVCPARRSDHPDHWSCGAISGSGQRDHHHRQRRRRSFCSRGGRGAVDFRAGQRRFAGMGFGDIAGDGPQSVGWNSCGRRGQDHRPAISRGRDGFGGPGGQGLNHSAFRRRRRRHCAP